MLVVAHQRGAESNMLRRKERGSCKESKTTYLAETTLADDLQEVKVVNRRSSSFFLSKLRVIAIDISQTMGNNVMHQIKGVRMVRGAW